VLCYGFGLQLVVAMKFTVIYFRYGTMVEINMSKSNTTNRNVSANNVNSFVFPILNILYVCLCTVPDILSYLTMKVTPFTKLDLPVKLFLFTCLSYTWQEVARLR
jgi:hypothetical protein